MSTNIMNDLLEKAQKMKDDIEKIKDDLSNNLVVNGESGGGLVKVKLNGRYDVMSVNLEPSLLKEKPEVIEELVAAAYNDATNKVREKSQEKLTDLTKNLQLPNDVKIPL